MGAAALLGLRGDNPDFMRASQGCDECRDAVAADSIIIGEQEPHALSTLFSTMRAPAEGRQTYTSGLNPKIRSYWRMCSW